MVDLLPSFNSFISLLISSLGLYLTYFIKKNLSKKEKDKYVIFLNKYCPSVSKTHAKIRAYYKNTSKRCYILFVSLLIGFFYVVFVISISAVVVNSVIFEPLTTFLSNLIRDLKPPVLQLSEYKQFLFIILCLYISILILDTFILIWKKFLQTKGYIDPKLTRNLSITKYSSLVFYSYWFFEGLLISTSFFIFNVVFNSTYFNRSTLSSDNLLQSFILLLQVIILYSGFIAPILGLLIIHQLTTNFSFDVKNQIVDSYRSSFPYIQIKTEYGSIKGQVIDFLNESLITLCEDGLLKAVPWDQIQMMEVSHINKNKQIIFDNSSKSNE